MICLPLRWVKHTHKTNKLRAKRDARAVDLLASFAKEASRKIGSKEDFNSFLKKWEAFEKTIKGRGLSV